MKDKRLLTLEERVSILEKKLRVVNEEESNPLMEAADKISQNIKSINKQINEFIEFVKNYDDILSKSVMSKIIRYNEVKLKSWGKWGEELAKAFSAEELKKSLEKM